MQNYITTNIGSYRSGSILTVIRKEGNPIAIAKVRSYTTAKYGKINMIWRSEEIKYYTRIKKRQMIQLQEEERIWTNFNDITYENNKAGHPIEHQRIINKVVEALKGN